MTSNPKHQHWVPRFYLRWFATPETRDTDNPKAWVFSKEAGNPHLLSIRKVAAQRFLYTPKGLGGIRSWWMEERLGDLESVLADVWHDLASELVDLHGCEHMRKAVALFIATLHLRHPNAHRMTAQLHSKLVAFLDDCPKDAGGNPLIEEIEHRGKVMPFDSSGYHEYKNAGPEEVRRMFIEAIRAHATSLAETLMEKRWSVVFTESPAFVTTDTPVVLVNEERTRFGTRTPGTKVIFPLTPTRLLVMDDRLDQPSGRYYPLVKDGPAPYNFTVWRGCSRFMISSRNTDEVCAEMLEWADGSPQCPGSLE